MPNGTTLDVINGLETGLTACVDTNRVGVRWNGVVDGTMPGPAETGLRTAKSLQIGANTCAPYNDRIMPTVMSFLHTAAPRLPSGKETPVEYSAPARKPRNPKL